MSSQTVRVNAAAVEQDALRAFNERRTAERRAALERQRQEELEMIAMAERARELRVQREAEDIEARRRAEQALIESKARAEKDAHEAAVAARIAALEARSPIEKLMAEMEGLRDQLEGRIAGLDSGYSTLQRGYSDLHRDYSGYKDTRPWESALRGVETRLTALQTELTTLKNTRPARRVVVPVTEGIFGNPSGLGVGSHKYLHVNYTVAGPSGGGHGTQQTVGTGGVFAVDIPAGSSLTINSAVWTNQPHAPNGAHQLDVSAMLRAFAA